LQGELAEAFAEQLYERGTLKIRQRAEGIRIFIPSL
jgi:hypothetical protein